MDESFYETGGGPSRDNDAPAVVGCMVVIILLVGLLVKAFFFPTNQVTEKTMYFDLNCRIVRVGQEHHLSNDKFHTPTVTNLVLLQSLRDTTEFMEYQVSDPAYYNAHEGDTLHWVYVRKDHFFHIKPR